MAPDTSGSGGELGTKQNGKWRLSAAAFLWSLQEIWQAWLHGYPGAFWSDNVDIMMDYCLGVCVLTAIRFDAGIETAT
jgi:hypothetical protein